MTGISGLSRRSRDLRRARATLLGSATTSEEERQLLAAVPLAIHRKDTMYQFGGHHYLSVGLSAVRCIDAAVGSTRAPTRVLDFACGFGRVLRFLPERFPEARVSAAEIDPRAVRFCARTFGVPTFQSTADLDVLRLPERFDVIWCGSLITHLDRTSAGHLFRLFADHLTPEGICILSAHGESSAKALENPEGAYGLSPEKAGLVLADYEAQGYGYADYSGHSGYGVSLASRETLGRMALEAGLEESSLQPLGWDDHHDVYGFVPAHGPGRRDRR